jgi:hypothetical protein
MTLKEIIKKCRTLSISELRRNSDEFCELVFYNEDIDGWNTIFADILGHPVKPPGIEPTEDDQHLTRDYGGTRVDQTVFRKEFDDVTVMAMFWPWQDGIHTTLKMALLRNRIEA